MGVLADMFLVSIKETEIFFTENLEKEIGKGPVRDEELEYVAKILTRFAHTSRYQASLFCPPTTFSDVFRRPVSGSFSPHDPEFLEACDAKILFLGGFFRDHMSVRHNLAFYDDLGQSFYHKAGGRVKKASDRQLFTGIGAGFHQWTIICQNTHKSLVRLVEDRLLLQFDI